MSNNSGFSLMAVLLIVVGGISIVFLAQNALKTEGPVFDENNLYISAKCTRDNTFELTCEDEACIEGEEERLAFDVWKSEFKKYHKLTEEVFNKYVSISDVVLGTGRGLPDSKVSVTFLYTNDWLKIPQRQIVSVRDEISGELFSEQEIVTSLKKWMNRYQELDSKTISLEVLRKLIEKPVRGRLLEADFCNIKFDVRMSGGDRGYVYGAPLIHASWSDNYKNICHVKKIDLISGQVVVDEHYDPCIITYD